MARKKQVDPVRNVSEVWAYGRNIAEVGGGVYPTRP
jgi:hypothetical protein